MANTEQTPRSFALEVVERLRKAGFQSLWAGGCVRDQLLGIEPKDYDVATNALPQEIRKLFGYRQTVPIGASSGVITVLGPRSAGQIEVATFRQDVSYSDGRHPDSVTFTTAEEDARRRDFTINGLFYDPIAEEVIDYVGGQADLQAGVIRAIGNPHERIAEDKLRMLRGVRFAAAFGFRLEETTQAAIAEHAAEIGCVSAERIAEELRKMLVSSQRSRAVKLMSQCKLLEPIFPEAAGAQESLDETLSILAALEAPTFSAAMAALLRNFTGPPGSTQPELLLKRTNVICRRLKLSNEQRLGVLGCLEQEPLLRSAQAAPWPQLQRVLIAPRAEELLSYCAAVAAVLDENLAAIDFCRAKLALPEEELNPPPLVNGNVLRKAGIRPGPAFRLLLENIRDAQLRGEINSQAEALELARQWMG